MKSLFLLFLLFCNLFFINFVTGLEGEEIIGGENAPLGKYPYHVGIEIFGSFACGGGIIDDYFVVTAAHCVTDAKGKLSRLPLRVVGGINDLKGSSTASGRVQADVEKVYIPKDFVSENDTVHIAYDIAVLKLQQPLGLGRNKYIGKLKLPLQASYASQESVITGFGWNWVRVSVDKKTGLPDEKGGTYHKLRYAKAQIITNRDCQSRYIKKIADSHICARVIQEEGNEGVCSGDSGGPLVYGGDMLIGVVSSSPVGCVENLRPAIYTRVSAFLGFVHTAMMDVPSKSVLSVRPVIMKNTPSDD